MICCPPLFARVAHHAARHTHRIGHHHGHTVAHAALVACVACPGLLLPPTSGATPPAPAGPVAYAPGPVGHPFGYPAPWGQPGGSYTPEAPAFVPASFLPVPSSGLAHLPPISTPEEGEAPELAPSPPVPEPSALLLLALPVAGSVLLRRRM